MMSWPGYRPTHFLMGQGQGLSHLGKKSICSHYVLSKNYSLDDNGPVEKMFEERKFRKMEKKKNTKFKAILFSIWVVIAYLGVQLLPSLVLIVPMVTQCSLEAGGDQELYAQLYMEAVSNSIDKVTLYQTIGSVLSFVLAAVWFYFGYFKKIKTGEVNKPDYKKIFTATNIGFWIFGTICVYGVTVLIQIGSMAILPQSASNAVSMIGEILGQNIFVTIFLALILAPIGEELAIRGIIVRKAENSFGLVGCMILSAVMFGILHMNPVQALYVLPMGLFWGYLSYKYKSVIPCIICHLLNNAFATLLSPLGIMDKYWLIGLFIVVGLVPMVIFGKKSMK